PVLLLQDLSTKRRRRPSRQSLVTGVEIRLPVRIERVGSPLDLEVAFGLEALAHPEDLLAGGRISKAPTFPRSMEKVTVSDPAPGLVRVAALSPAKQPPPHETVQPEEGLATEGVAMVVGPTSQKRVEPIDEDCWGGTGGLLTQSADLGFEGLEAGRAGFD